MAFPPPPPTGAPSRLQDTRGSGTPRAAQGSSTSSPSRTASSVGPVAMTGGTGWGRRAGACSHLDSQVSLQGAGEGAEQRSGQALGLQSRLTLHDEPGPPRSGARGVASHAQVGACIPRRGPEEMQLPVGEHLQPRPCRDGQERRAGWGSTAVPGHPWVVCRDCFAYTSAPSWGVPGERLQQPPHPPWMAARSQDPLRCHPAPCWDAYNLRAPKSPQVLPPSSRVPLTSGNADTVFLPSDLRPGNPGGLTGQNCAGVDHHHHHTRQGFQGRGFCEWQGSVAHWGSRKVGQGTGRETPRSHAYRAPRAGGVFGPCQQRSLPCRCSVRRVQAAPA